MSSNPPVPPPPPAAPPAPPMPPAAPPRVPAPGPTVFSPDTEIKVVSHSTVFYWWPVWFFGLIMALLTLVDGWRMILVPADAEARRDWQVVVGTTTTETGATIPQTKTKEGVLLEKG